MLHDLIYGQYPAHTGCYENTPMPQDGRQSFMAALTQSGYRTHGIGKCHFAPDALALRGFETREVQEELAAGTLDQNHYLRYLYDHGYTHLCEPNGVRGEMYYIPQPSQLPPRDHPSQWIGDRSVSFIRENEKSGRPWYLFSSFIHPHPPFAPPNPWHKLFRAALMPLPSVPDDWQGLQTFVNRCQNRYKYRDNGWDQNLLRVMKAYYYACISFVDFQVGRILDALEATGQADDTMVLFTSDHGEHLGDYRCFGKRSMHDSCARIPFILRYPGKLEAGRVYDGAVSLVDVAPTFTAAAGTQISSHPMDGVDLCRLVAGEIKREYVFGQLSFPGGSFLERDGDFEALLQDKDTARAVFSTYMAASNRWKYFYSAPDNREYLFDKTTDPRETRNIAASPFTSAPLAQMKSALLEHLRQAGETRGLENGDWKPFRVPPFTGNADSGLLIQDVYTPWVDVSLPGYTDASMSGNQI